MTDNLPEIVSSNLTGLGAGPGDRFLIALSGGGDSTALALAMCKRKGRETLVAAHLDHAVREGSKEDRAKVEELCRNLGLTVISDRLDPEAVAAERKRCGSLEGALRTLRYGFLEQAAKKAKADWILTGHTLDDQAETVLFRVHRGMDWRSLSGIPAKRGRILRPMLGVTGVQAREYCRRNRIVPLEDPSNFQNCFTRNRIRRFSIPALVKNFHPDLPALLARVAHASKSLAGMEEKLSGKISPGEEKRSDLVMDLTRFSDLPASLQTGAVIRFLERGLKGQPSGALVTDTVRFLRSGATGRIDLPEEAVLEVAYGKGMIRRRRSLGTPLPEVAVPLAIPGTVNFPDAGFSIVAEDGLFSGELDDQKGKTAFLSAKRVGATLWVRGRRPGDRFMPLGMEKEKKLKDFLIDRKVPRPDRDYIPLILDEKGRIVWVAGVEISMYGALDKVQGEKMVILTMMET
ncbi:MAG: tRNA lysidine(34) synthetase TilS [bacterium]|nr:tRNA lysidine(34) synthetase TilS [bacterium]MDT8396908.1 tRNA lysidine(34) synthetase TilS [bacterium]